MTCCLDNGEIFSVHLICPPTLFRCRFRVLAPLIVAAAQSGGCSILLTEDLSHGQMLDGVRVVDPFREEPPKERATAGS